MEETFQHLAFLGVIFSAQSVVIAHIPLLITGFLVVSEVAKKRIDQGGMVPLSGFLKPYFDKGVHHKADFVKMRADSEVYLGVFFVLGMFLGMSSIVTLLIYGQIMRMKYMISYDTKQAFSRFD